MATKAMQENQEVQIVKIETQTVNYCVLGTSPLICNRMSQKGWHELLAPKGKKTTAEKASNMKHNPLQEFRDSPYVMVNPSAPTLLAILPTAFKKAMGTAALDSPGAKKSQIGRLVSVDWDMQPVYGTPRVHMAITRSADMNRTPDVRTRAILPEWACKLRVTFVKPILREKSVTDLLVAAGIQSGVGEWRQEKGSGSFGAFTVVDQSDEKWNRIVSTQGRQAQQEAMDNPVAFDAETEELLSWFDVELKRRGFKVAA